MTEAKILNIGRGGFFVALTDRFPIHQEEVEFHIQPLDLKGAGIVRWVRQNHSEDYPSGCGVEFKVLSDESKEKVIDLIENTKPKSFIPRK